MRLTELHVYDMPDLSDVQPLLDNTGLGAGDRVILMRSAIRCADAAALVEKGVSVGSSCPSLILRQGWPGILATLAVLSAALAVAVVAVRRVLARWRMDG